jgi:deoxyribonuclease V
VKARYGAVDVHYPDAGGARAALVVAEEPTFGTVTEEHVAELSTVEAYSPGMFFVRELPAIIAVLAETADLNLVIVDGYVDLDPDGRKGLGAHLREHITAAVVGVAKTPFRTATHAPSVHRGGSTRPLYVTAVGIDPSDAAAMVSAMAGAHRIPDALRRVDALSRQGERTSRMTRRDHIG